MVRGDPTTDGITAHIAYGRRRYSIAAALDDWTVTHGRYIPGFGHRFHHDADPRVGRLLELAEQARVAGAIAGGYIERVQAIGRILSARKGRTLPMNVGGIAGAIFLELGFAPVLGRGLIVLSRSFGILANAWEELCQGSRLKGPVPPSVGYRFDGVARRELP